MTDACDVIDLKGSTATPEFLPRLPAAAARRDRHVQHTRVVVQAAARTDVVSASWSRSRPAPLLQLLTSSASVLLIKDPSVSRWRQPCTAELSTQSVQKQAKKHLNMETHLSRTNERTAASKPVSPIGRRNSELIFRSHVTGVYHCRAKMSTDHLFFWFTHITKHLDDINIH